MIKKILAGVSVLLLLSCGKNKLTGDYENMIGRYEWVSTGTNDHNIFSSSSKEITSAHTGYTAAIELNDKGEIIFYKNGAVLAREKYTIRDRETRPGGGYLNIKLKGKTSEGWDIDQEMVLELKNDTAFSCSRYPFPAIDKANVYFKDHSSQNNIFVKK